MKITKPKRNNKSLSDRLAAEQVLDYLRRWLKDGATITATDPKKPVLEISNGVCNGGMTITWPEKTQG